MTTGFSPFPRSAASRPGFVLASMLNRRRPFSALQTVAHGPLRHLILLRLTACGVVFYPTRRRAFAIDEPAPPLRRSRVPQIAEPEHSALSLMRSLLLNSSTDNSAKSKGMICPIALCRARRSYLPNAPTQPKHDSRPRALGRCFLTKLRFQAALEYLGIGFLVFCRRGVQEHGGKRSQFPTNSFGRGRIVDYWHLPLLDPVTGFSGIKAKEFGAQASGSAQGFSPESSTVPLSAAVKGHFPSPNFLANHMLCPRPKNPRYSSPR